MPGAVGKQITGEEGRPAEGTTLVVLLFAAFIESFPRATLSTMCGQSIACN